MRTAVAPSQNGSDPASCPRATARILDLSPWAADREALWAPGQASIETNAPGSGLKVSVTAAAAFRHGRLCPMNAADPALAAVAGPKGARQPSAEHQHRGQIFGLYPEHKRQPEALASSTRGRAR